MGGQQHPGAVQPTLAIRNHPKPERSYPKSRLSPKRSDPN
jgi:hypothetical protein